MSILYQLEYNTTNLYDAEVAEGHFDFKILPLQEARQKLISYKVGSNLNVPYEVYKNHQGFDVVRVHIYEPFQEFKLQFNATVEVEERNVFDLLFKSPQKEQAYYQSDECLLKHYSETQITPNTVIDIDRIKDFPVFTWKQQIFYYLEELNHSIHDYLSFDTHVTDVDSTLEEVLNLKKGVCQDYAHLYIAIARNYGIAVRYVSGYLHQGKDFKGASQLHAWVEAYVPYIGWIGFDPTNAILADHHYIKICHGSDYYDCSPIKGVLRTSGSSQTSYEVRVETQ